MEEEKERLKFAELEEALNTMGWTDWTIIAFSPFVQEYKVFSHFESDDSFEMFEFILKKILKICEEGKKNNKIGGSC